MSLFRVTTTIAHAGNRPTSRFVDWVEVDTLAAVNDWVAREREAAGIPACATVAIVECDPESLEPLTEAKP